MTFFRGVVKHIGKKKWCVCGYMIGHNQECLLIAEYFYIVVESDKLLDLPKIEEEVK